MDESRMQDPAAVAGSPVTYSLADCMILSSGHIEILVVPRATSANNEQMIREASNTGQRFVGYEVFDFDRQDEDPEYLELDSKKRIQNILKSSNEKRSNENFLDKSKRNLDSENMFETCV